MTVTQKEKNKGILSIVKLNFGSAIAIHLVLIAAIHIIHGFRPAHLKSTTQQQYYSPSLSHQLVNQSPVCCGIAFNPTGIDHYFGLRHDVLLNAGFGE